MADADMLQAALDELRRIDRKVTELLRVEGISTAAIVTQGGGLSDIDENLGLVMAGEFRAGNGIQPGLGFTGIRIGYPEFSYGDTGWHVVGVNSDTLQFGLRASDGVAVFGAGAVTLNAEGIIIQTGQAQANSITWRDVAGADGKDYGLIYGFKLGSGDNTYGTLALQAAANSSAKGVNPPVILNSFGRDSDGNVANANSNFTPRWQPSTVFIGDDQLASSSFHGRLVQRHATTNASISDGFGVSDQFYLEDDGGDLHAVFQRYIEWDDVSENIAEIRYKSGINYWHVYHDLDTSTVDIVVNDDGGDVNFRTETDNFPYGFGTDAGEDAIILALDVRGVSGTAYPKVGINTPLPQHLFEIHKTTWNQVADLEEGNTTDFDGVAENGSSTFTATEASKKNGTYGVSVEIDGSQNSAFGSFTDPTNETGITLETWLDPNTLPMGTNESFVVAYSDNGRVYLRYDGSDYLFQLWVNDDGGAQAKPGAILTDDWHHIRLVWAASTGAGNDDGYAYLYVDGVLYLTYTGLDNDTKTAGTVNFGAHSSIDAGTSGIFYMDDCKWRDGSGLVVTGDGDVVFEGSGGLIFGEICANDAADAITISGTGQANKAQVTSFDADGLTNRMTASNANDDITVLVAGMYFCSVSVSLSSAGGGGADDIGLAVYKNNGATEFDNLHGHRKLSGGGGDRGSVTMSGIIDLAVGDTIEVWVWNENSTDNVVIDDITLSLMMIGGT